MELKYRLEINSRDGEDTMMKKTITVLVILSFLGFSKAYANDSECNDAAVEIALVAGIAFVTTAILIASHDRHEEYRPSPRHSHNRVCDSRGCGKYRPHDNRRHDNKQHAKRRHGEGPGDRSWNRWEGR